MITLKVKPINTIEDLRASLQQAIELEHATIPTYLTTMFSCGVTHNQNVANIIKSVVIEEMLHMSIAANVLNAVGGHPVINRPGFIPSFPGPLPGGVAEGLTVTLEKMTKEHVKNVFMAIEEPEHPIVIEGGKLANRKMLSTSFSIYNWTEEEEMTIGEFYTIIKEKITILEEEAIAHGTTIFTGSLDVQFVDPMWFPTSELFPITDVSTSHKGIDIIIDQGEGTTSDPFDEEGQPAHYYRFQEIVEGRELVKDPSAPSGYSFSGAVIPFLPTEVTNTVNNPRTDNPNNEPDVYIYTPGTQEYIQNKLFNFNYTNLLNALHLTFNGEQERINDAMGMMYALRLSALQLMQIPLANKPSYFAAPSFQFVTNEDMSPEELEMANQMKVAHVNKRMAAANHG